MSDINTINYEPLEADKHAFRLAFKQHAATNTALLVGGPVAFIIGFFMFNSFAVAWIGLSLSMLRLFYLGTQIRAFKDSVWWRFAEANGWLVIPELAPELLLPPSLQFGGNQVISPVIGAQLGTVRADMFVYQTTVGEGKNRQVYYFSVARVVLPVSLPHIMLRAKHGISDEVRQDFADGEKLQLEGDFEDYFSLQIENGHEVDALEILTPDVMQALVSFSQREDIEILMDSMYFIVSGDNRTPEGITKLVQSIVSLTEQIVEQIAQTTVPQAAVPLAQTATVPPVLPQVPAAVQS